MINMDKDKLQVTLILPTMNEIDGMRWFMPQLNKAWYDELIIVDGNSHDGTVRYCEENGYPVFIQSKKGYTNAYREAFNRATKDIIVAATPDGNSLPEIIPLLTAKIRDGYDVAVASRYFGAAKSYDDDFFTGIGNKVFTWIINLLFRARYTDTLVGFRAFSRNAIVKMDLYEDKTSIVKKVFPDINIESPDVRSGIRAAKLKLKICEIPADEPRRIGGKRKLSVLRNGSEVLLQILDEFFTRRSYSTPKS
jgi:glycosyltransferase involved in cell wall biosynthesis